ncbi:1-acyl-sn-glycerol-3-phosphate acyltransferase PLS1-like [Rutidosis leptorrhynchoides]|uniref:1-acyl-sn-glycerol-3-phosphate acyltransferase PLS1-like n=1 Tax=Rutidosis leptorrhynchoides TaxID=125765 RepID=UPI003A9A4047
MKVFRQNLKAFGQNLKCLNVVLIRPLSKNAYKRYKGVLSDMAVCFLWRIIFSRVKFFDSFANTLSLSKNSIKYVPVYGWISWISSRFIYLERNWKNDAFRLKTALEVVKRSYRPWWFIVFPEGTRVTPQKLIEARDYATSQGLHVPKNVLIPRIKGFVLIVNHSRGHFKAVYDVTVTVPHACLRPTLSNILKGEQTTIIFYIKRYPMEELPESDKNVGIWCRQRFTDKDFFLDKYNMAQQMASDGQISCTIRNKKHIHVAGVSASLVLQVGVLLYYLLLPH